LRTDKNEPVEQSGLRRELGLPDAVGIGFGAIVGAGIFVVTGIAAGIAGPALLIALFIAAIAAGANALSSAQLAAEYPRAGGTYEYGYQVLGQWPGFVAGWMFLASKIAAAGTVALGLAGYTNALLPAVPPRAIAVSAVILFTALNYFGIRRSSRTNLAIVLISVGALLLFVLLGMGSVRTANFRPFAPAGWRGVMEAAALLFFAYTGYARIATLAEEVSEPRRTIPRAIVITMGGVVLLYFAVAIVAVGSIGADAMAVTAAPLYAAALTGDQPWVATVVALGGVTAMLGVILSQLLGLSRMAFAMARRGDLPRHLDHIHPDHGAPGRAVLVIGAVTAVVAATGTLRSVAAAASFAILIYYWITNLAAIRMHGRKLVHDAVPVIGLLACTALALSLSPGIVGTGLVLLAAGVIWRLVWRAR
jgi:basic amino acid/polyamine antiporter, APA family